MARVYDGRSAGPAVDLVVVGAATRDLADDDPRGWRLGGGAAYCSLTAARLGLRVGCLIGLDEAAGRARELDLIAAAGVEVVVAPLARGPVFENIEVSGRRFQRWSSGSDPVDPGSLPEQWRSARGWLLAPMAGEIGAGWASVPPPGACVGLGWQGLLRRLDADGSVAAVPPYRSALLDRAGLVCISRHDLGPGGGPGPEGLAAFVPGGVVIVTEGAAGGVALTPGGGARFQAFPAAALADPTGAGDVFLAALMVEWLRGLSVADPGALRFASAAGSLAVEGIGLLGVPTRVQVEARLRSRSDLPPS